jgi:hypothetical protein
VAVVVVAAGLLAVGVLLYSRFFGPKVVLRCSATQPRPSGLKAWEDAMAPVEIPVELEGDLFDKCKINSDDESLLITHPLKNPSENVFAYELSEMTIGEALEIDGGTLKLCALGTAYLDSIQTIADDAEYGFYDTQFRSISKEQVAKLNRLRHAEQGTTFRYDPFPAVQFGFEHERIEDLMFHGIKVFDASTRMILSSGYSRSGGRRYNWFKTDIPLWHRTPVDIVIDVSYGPVKTFEFAPTAGEGFIVEGVFECRLLSVLEGVDTSWSGSSGSDNTLTLRFRKAESGMGGLRFVFLCQPHPSGMPVTFDFLDKEGKKLFGGGSSTSSNIHSVDMNQPLRKIALIRARYRTQRRRIVVRLPYIPGLPEENNAVDDLFDVRIPYVRFRDVGRFTSFLGQTLQLKNTRQSGPRPANNINNAPFPLEFSGKTMREIAQIYSEGGDFEIDIEDDQLNLKYPLPLSARLKDFWQRIFGK